MDPIYVLSQAWNVVLRWMWHASHRLGLHRRGPVALSRSDQRLGGAIEVINGYI
jgi:hypothetical protein